jgi:hypothetical protein
MIFSINNKHILVSISLIMTLIIAPSTQAATNNAKKVKHNNRFYLVPPPPPYVPSMLPELTRYRGNGQSFYSNSTTQAGNSLIIYKPNKYLTYCYPNKG